MLLFSLFFVFIFVYSVKTQSWECSKCRTVVTHFIEGVRKTEGKNFGGGNTLWEQEKLGSYSTSEARLHDIMDSLCTSSSLKEADCHKFVGDYEHNFEDWWASKFRNDPNSLLKIEEHLCIDVLKACCPFGFYGPTCSPCMPCNINGGRCSGNGTRVGSGECICSDGYSGSLCETCNTDTHYVSSDADGAFPVCMKCHKACSGGCTGPGTNKCSMCAEGWSRNGSECVDINECDTIECSSGQFCVNTVGSYRCDSCDASCESCGGPTSNDCISCATGYQRGEGGVCEDINECSADSNVCQGIGERCINTAGSYLCECKSGYEKVSGSCKPISTQSQPSDTSPSISDIYGEESHIHTAELTEDKHSSLETQRSEL